MDNSSTSRKNPAILQKVTKTTSRGTHALNQDM